MTHKNMSSTQHRRRRHSLTQQANLSTSSSCNSGNFLMDNFSRSRGISQQNQQLSPVPDKIEQRQKQNNKKSLSVSPVHASRYKRTKSYQVSDALTHFMTSNLDVKTNKLQSHQQRQRTRLYKNGTGKNNSSMCSLSSSAMTISPIESSITYDNLSGYTKWISNYSRKSLPPAEKHQLSRHNKNAITNKSSSKEVLHNEKHCVDTRENDENNDSFVKRRITMPTFSITKFDERNSQINTSMGQMFSAGFLKSPKFSHSKKKSSTSQPGIFSKFTSAVGRPGQARETREFVSRALNSANPIRQTPISAPMDYEKFISEKSAQLEHDRDRDLLLFLRDDISQCELIPKERCAISSVTPYQMKEAKWLLTLDSLRHYSSVYKIINFNYAKFFGDFKKWELTQSLNHLRFESDIALEEEKMFSNGQQLSSDIIKEGFLVVVPGENSFVDNFRSEKKRYCVVRRDADGRVMFEVFKQQQQQPQTPQLQQQQQNAGVASQPPLEIKSANLKTTRKGKTVLQVAGNPENDKRVLILAAEADAELAMWLVEIDRAISLSYREDSLSMSSSGRGASAQPSTAGGCDSESVISDESTSSLRDLNLGMVWRGRNAAAKALHPPIVERRNIFSLYWNLDPLPDSDEQTSALILSAASEQKLQRNVTKTVAPLAAFETSAKNTTNAVGGKGSPLSTPTAGVAPSPLKPTDFEEDQRIGTAVVSPTPSQSSIADEKPMILFVAEVKRLNVRVSIASGAPEQIEPFFLQLFLFDASTGTRISEEFQMDVYPPASSSFYGNGNPATHAPSTTVVTESRQGNRRAFSIGNERLNGVNRRQIMHPDARKLICSIPNPRSGIFLIAKVERLLSDCPSDIYSRGSVDLKNAAKVTKSISAAAQRLSHYRTMFAYAVRPVFPSMCNTGGTFGDSRCLSLFKCEGRLTDSDLQKTLIDFAKLEKSGKLSSIAGASIDVEVEITSTATDIPTFYTTTGLVRISPSLLPLRPWRIPSDSPLAPAFELQSFVQESVFSEPFKSHINLLYVNPISLNYGGQKSFNRARNIACTVRFVGSKRRKAENINAIIDRTNSAGPYVRLKHCGVQYHEQNPQFNDEIKVQLPCALDSTDHLLFTFTHISVANALSPKSPAEPFEAPIGYAWLPLVCQSENLDYLTMTDNVQEFDLSVAINLPNCYINSHQSGTSGGAAPEIKYVDNGRPLFRVKLRLISSIFSTDQCVQAFFQNYQLLEAAGLISKYLESSEKFALQKEKSTSSFTSSVGSNVSSTQQQQQSHNRSCSPYVDERKIPPADELGDDAHFGKEDAFRRLIGRLKALAITEIYHLIPFLHSILHRLFILLTCSPNDEIALNALNVIIVIADRVAETKSRNEFLRDFVYLHARYVISSAESEMTTFEALCKYIPMLIRNVYGDPKAMSGVFNQMWFLLDCAVKFMAQYLIENKLFKASRRERFSAPFLLRVETLLQCLTDQMIVRHRDLPDETKHSNIAIAYFLKYCLSIMDRYVIMNQIHYVVNKMDSCDSKAMRSYKLDMLRIISGHEHWIPLCLPLLTDKAGNVMRSDSSAMAAMLDNNTASSGKGSGGFFSKFFAQIFSTSAAVQESSEADRCLLLDANYLEHFYLCPTYYQTHFLVGVLLHELVFALKDSREHRHKVIVLLRNLLAKHSADSRYTDSSAQNRIAVLYTPVIRITIENIREFEATAKASADSPDASPMAQVSTTSQLKSRTLGADARSASSQMSGTNKSLRSFASGGAKTATLPSQITATDLGRISTSGVVAQAGSVSAIVSPTTSGSNFTAASTNNNNVLVFAEKLDKQEVCDMILCVLYILNRLPKRTLGALWCAQENIKSSSEAAANAAAAVSPPPSSSLSAGDAEKSGESSQHGSSNLNSTSVYLDFIRMLELAMFMFRYRGRFYHVREQAKRRKNASKTLVNFQSFTDQQRFCTSDSQFSSTSNVSAASGTNTTNLLNDVEDLSVDGAPTAMSFLQDCHLTQEVALIVLDTAQTLANQIATRAKQLSDEVIDAAFYRLLKLKIHLLDVNWPENVRLHSLAALAVFINLFSERFFQSGPLDCLSLLIEAILLQLNSRFVRVQNAAAALLQLVLRNGFDVASNIYGRDHFDNRYNRSNSLSVGSSVVERLGRPGTQTGVALAHLLSGGQRHPLLLTTTGARFERGLGALESFVITYGDRRDCPSLFEKAVLELIKQLRGVLEATSALADAANDPIRLADLHLQLANSYRGSAALRCAWFDTLANIHASERWYAEAAVCQAHAIAIIGKELVVRGELKIDWTLLDMINSDIATEENVFDQQLDSTQQAGYTLDNFTTKVEQTLQTLVLSERYEAVGPLCRLVIPIYESSFNYKALVSLYAELQQSSSRAAEIKASGKRHLGSYFRVVFYGLPYFANEHKSEWVYREPRLTSLAEACDRMIALLRQSLNHDSVEILPPEQETDVDADRLRLTTAYVQMTHVEPCSMARIELQRKQSFSSGKSSSISSNGTQNDANAMDHLDNDDDPMSYRLHTNVRTFVYEERITDASAPSNAPEQARLALRRIVLTTEKCFPNTRRRQRVVGRTEFVLTPLDVACDSLVFKASQIRRILNAAGISRGAYGFDKAALRRLDLKQLQLFLQGSVSPTVNAGVLSYAEAFTAPAQKSRYGAAGIAKLVSAFKILMTELAEALHVNEAAMGSDRNEYQLMLRNSFDGMLERLSTFFRDEKFVLTQQSRERGVDSSDIAAAAANAGASNIFGMISGTTSNIGLDSARQSVTSTMASGISSVHTLDSGANS